MNTRQLLVPVVGALVLSLAACSGGSKGTSGTPTPTLPPAPTATPTPTRTPTPNAARAQTPTGTPGGALVDYCSGLNSLKGFLGFGANLPEGVSLKGSPNPTSDEARALAAVVQASLSEALGGNVTATCFMEARQDNKWSAWTVFNLPGAPAPDASSKIASAFKSRGVEVGGTFTGSTGAQNVVTVSLEGLPIGDDRKIGGGIYIVGNQAIMVGGEDGGGGSGADETPEPTATTGGGAGPTPTVQAVSPTGLAGDVDTQVRGALQSALGVDLTPEGAYTMTQGASSVATLSYHTSKTASAGAAGHISDALRAFGATTTSTLEMPDGVMVTYEGLLVNSVKTSGTVSWLESTLSIVAQVG